MTGVEGGKENVRPSKRYSEKVGRESVLVGPCNSFTKGCGLHSEQEVTPLREVFSREMT